MNWINDGDTKVPIANWASLIDKETIEQAKTFANIDVVFDHISLMPDSHVGCDVPIGSVIATKNAIIPSSVGVDIGCGMAFIETNIPISLIKSINTVDSNLLRTMLLTIKKVIPLGFAHHSEPQSSYLLDNPPDYIYDIPVIVEEIEKAKYQLGTLGGGNHFIELQSNEKDNLCLMLHSGSRNFGYKIADYFNKITKEIGFPYLFVDDKNGKDYISSMQFALEFAKENRRIMMERFKSVVFNLIKKYTNSISVEIVQEVNIHHNYASLEEHYGEQVWVHRKGAIRVDKGIIGIIPGSMGTSSYIVKGKGNKESFCSASHGSGRKMGRNVFNKQYSIEEAEKSMNGIEHLGWSIDRKGKIDLSEAPEAYKDIDIVINNELDLVDIIMKLKPIANLKC
ncbi:MAG: RtcB family protein [Methanothrix sp.]|jgi:tRNA-splicing ligase RtcB|nr:RtcB family protein [Methanothrix sp.]